MKTASAQPIFHILAERELPQPHLRECFCQHDILAGFSWIFLKCLRGVSLKLGPHTEETSLEIL